MPVESSRKIFFAATLTLACALSATVARQFKLTSVGCFIDLTTGGRDVNELKDFGFTRFGQASLQQGTYENFQSNVSVRSSTMTHDLCGSVCALGGFQYIVLQSWEWCYCGNVYGRQGSAASTDCNSACSGNATQNCGANYRNFVLKLNYICSDCFVLGNRTLVGISKPNAPAFWSLKARRLTECIFLCGVGCEAVVFNHEQGLCHLLEYAVVPAALDSAGSGEFFVRG